MLRWLLTEFCKTLAELCPLPDRFSFCLWLARNLKFYIVEYEHKKLGEYLLFFCVFFFLVGIPPPPPPHQKKKKIFFLQIWILCQNSLTRELKIRVVGFVLKKLFTYFVMLIVPLALHCVDGCCFVFYRSWQSGILFWFQCSLHLSPPPPPPPHPTPSAFFFLFRYGLFVKIHLLESSKLELQGLHLRSYSHILKCWLYHMP